jgi:hypothetical protein
MEFETNKAVPDSEVIRASVPHVTIQPVHPWVTPDVTYAPTPFDSTPHKSFDFETESTAAAAISNAKIAQKPQHLTALVLTLLTLSLFSLSLYVFYSISSY